MYAGVVGVVVEVHPAAPNAYVVVDSNGTRFATYSAVAEPIEPLPPDIPRAAVEDLLAAVEKRAAECDSKRVQYRAEGHETWAAEEYVRRTELIHVARCLRKLLGGES
jgi:hypothetical protein